MKKFIFSLAPLLLTLMLQAQTSPVDEMFNKYAEKEGFTVVTISSKMLSMFSDKAAEDKNTEDVISKLKSIRIISVEDSLLNKNLNFYTELTKRLDLSVYEELMAVKEGRDITKFLIKQSGKTITELLVIQGGPGGNSLISITGNLNLKNITDISKSIDIQGLNDLEKLENQSPEE